MGDVHYVDVTSTTAVYPYTDWSTAAAVLQDAVDAAALGDEVLVADGVYDVGGLAVHGNMTNRVCVPSDVMVRSVNGAAATTIRGQPASGGGNGDGAIRCVYLGSNAVLRGFTLTDGHTGTAGDTTTERSGGGCWLEPGSMVSECRIVSNAASWRAGGAYSGTLVGCVLSDNSADNRGGGTYGATLVNCLLNGNRAEGTGGGGCDCTLSNCTVRDNAAGAYGGGLYRSSAYNSIVYGNMASLGANYHLDCVFASSCTWPYAGPGNIFLDPLWADGMHLSADSPCIGRGAYGYCTGTDIDGDPWNMQPSIGCDEYVGSSATGALAVAIATDYATVAVDFTLDLEAVIQGHALGNVWSFGDGTAATNQLHVRHAWGSTGVYEVVLAAHNTDLPAGVAATALVSIVQQPVHYVDAANGSPAYPYQTWPDAATSIQPAIDACEVAGALVLVTNGVYASGGLAVHEGLTNRVAIVKPVIVRSVGGPAATTIEGQGPVGDTAVRCAYVGADALLSGFTLTNGATLSAGYFDTAKSGGGAWCDPSGMLSNCVLSGNASAGYGGGVYRGTIRACTLTGNSAASIGGGACGATLEDCVLAGNTTAGSGGGAGNSTLRFCAVAMNSAVSGGGVYNSILENCVLTGNSAQHSGGANHSTLCNCVLAQNTAVQWGGGTAWSTLYNCTLTGNSAADGGGAYTGALFNCIAYYNTATNSGDNHLEVPLAYCCTVPAAGAGSVTNPPLFVDLAGGDYRLAPESPCVDAGMNMGWLADARDLAGNPRVLNGTVDIGAYEVPFALSLDVYLQGAYDTNLHAMRTALRETEWLPLAAPYAADRRVVAAVPTNATDWVLVQLRAQTNGAPVVSRSALLRCDGRVVDPDGRAELAVPVAAGAAYHVVLKHRNHAAVISAAPLMFTNLLTSLDFTAGPLQYLGGAEAAVELEPGVWGMMAGDADGDGLILAADSRIHATQTNRAGYLRGDFGLDGMVAADDASLFWTPNAGRAAMAPDALTVLSPDLRTDPMRITVLTGQAGSLSAPEATGVVHWVAVHNGSGGTLLAETGTNVLWQAGETSSCVDLIEAWDEADRLGRVFVNVLSADDVAAAGKAVLVAGRKGEDDPLWPNTQYLAHTAYNTLLYRGYSKGNLQYLSPVTNQDVDGNSEWDDVDLASTHAAVAHTFTNWANNTSNLFVHLVDHGTDSAGSGAFRLNPAETLAASTLDGWLDDLQDTYGTKVTVLIDCCYAGSLLDELSYDGPADRVVIASSGTNQPAYFVAGGLVSFSDAFYNGVLLGYDVAGCYALATNAMALYQDSEYYDSGDGTVAQGAYLGATLVATKDIPRIGTVCGNQLLSGDTTAALWADDIDAPYRINRSWCLVVPPGHSPDPDTPVDSIPELDLIRNEQTGRYEAQYDGFTEEGSYKVIYYVRDDGGGVSLPVQRYVVQQAYDERVILVNGGRTNAAAWATMDTIARRAYHTFIKRWFEPASICYMSFASWQDLNGDGSNDVDTVPALTNLEFAITEWAAATNAGGPADKLTVYLVGEETDGKLALGATETLDAATLDYWLDTYQATNEPKVITILEFPKSGGFIPALTAPAACERITLASAAANDACLWAAGGKLSFSSAFLGEIFNGRTVGYAFEKARDCMRRASGHLRQMAQLDDDGDGLPNETDEDGRLAKLRYLGTAFVTGADNPDIGVLMPDTQVTDVPGSLLLWAAGITDLDGVSNVWCTVTSPDYDGANDLPQVEMAWNESAQRFEATYTNFTLLGTNVVTFFAEDRLGELSAPRQAAVLVLAYDTDHDEIPDAWEEQYFQGATNADAETDSDGDTYSNWAEWLAGSDPTNAASMFELGSPAAPGTAAGVILSWPSLSNRIYMIDFTTNLVTDPFVPLVTNLPATPVENVYTDEQHSAEGLLFYRIRVGKE
ncbi:MAG: hypothetical protein JXR37_15495 [Kiritimatiellae bacterium]|nr:hypothetical protein [Kiritimatiellia bacterium]